ncbi:heavy metal-associated domain-containing protein [Arthrobacter sp. MYb213]|uniref:heavy-metal-associated domain-containing protein n=1 Tax=Arthrobacter sp. MYb213 TaxID=1848595 RepID=UPI000CFC5216|nr:heavy metal-associated domain-containing protein [Arthrobacter sp. MYb213]PRB68746.1 heavy metal transporter [Arthrobacter sp. MYb213]
MSSNITLKIDGLTCGHCVSSVTEELQEIAGVGAVEVDLVVGGTSTATVATEAQVENSVFEAAISEAGYNLVSVDA